jgi:hypothetical protein
MAFKWVYNHYGAPITQRSDIYGTNATTFTEGEALQLTSGRWAVATNGAAVAGFAAQTITTTTDTLVTVNLAREGDVWEAPYTGTPAAGFVVGVMIADVSADGLSVLSSDVTGGPFSILAINTTKVTCQLQVKLRTFT